MIKFIHKLILPLLLICAFVQSKAQVAPSGIVFQAVARDINNNAAANRNVYAIVNILEGNSNGNRWFTIKNENTPPPNENGDIDF